VGALLSMSSICVSVGDAICVGDAVAVWPLVTTGAGVDVGVGVGVAEVIRADATPADWAVDAEAGCQETARVTRSA
jgi:hypothetical protein